MKSKKHGGADCASCHSGDFFTDEAFHNIGMPQMGRGKGDGAGKEEDFGRFRETKLAFLSLFSNMANNEIIVQSG